MQNVCLQTKNIRQSLWQSDLPDIVMLIASTQSACGLVRIEIRSEKLLT